MGFFPKLDLRTIHFPQLRTLALGNYTFTHDWQLEWITSHALTLQNLYLDDCPILYQMILFLAPKDSEGYYVNPEDRGFIMNWSDRQSSWSYS